MDTERWHRVDALFADALALDPEERSAFLRRACGPDRELRHSVESLVAADEKALSFLEKPVLEARPIGCGEDLAREDLEDRGEEPGDALRFGPYRIERHLGRGGMGTVYIARRDDGQFDRRVALKLLHRGRYDPEVLRQFRAERQILARLEHPSIARLYDGGESDDGLPFLVMEYIEGSPLDVYCDRHRLGIDDRLRLCRRLFEAVAFAHQNLLVHRDIKPANVLVTTGGELKLLDFGISTPLSVDGSTGPEAPQAMTPGYASPEQLRGEAVTTASDVYALGVVLYQLLCGCCPYGLGRDAPAADLERAILERVPEMPSRALARLPERSARRLGRARGSSPAALRQKLRGDLDAIVSKALRKDPRHRYASVTELAADVERHLQTRPVLARPQTPSYRAGRLLRRHRAGAALFLAALVILLASLWNVHRQSGRVARERDKAEEALDFLVNVFEHADPYQRGAENVSAVEILEAGNRRVTEELSENPEVQAALMTAMGKAAVGLRQMNEAEPLLERALRLRREVAPDSLELAASLDQMAWFRFLTSDYDAAEKHYREALELRKRLAGSESAEVATTLNYLGMVLGERWQSVDATRSAEIEALHREALRIFQKVQGPEGTGVAYTLFRLAKLAKDRGDLAAAEELSRENLRICALGNGESHPETATSLRLLSLVLLDREKLDEAEGLLERALTIQRQALPENHPDALLTLNDLALTAQRMGKLAEAEDRFRKVVAAYASVFGEVHGHTAVVMHNHATTLVLMGRNEEGAALLERTLEIKREIFGGRHAFVSKSLNVLAQAYSALGRHREAVEKARLSLAIAGEVVGTEHPSYARALQAVGAALHAQGLDGEAKSHLARGLELFRATQPEGSVRTARTEVLLGSCLNALGHSLEAQPLLTAGLHTLAARYPAEHPWVLEARQAMAASNGALSSTKNR